MKTNQLPAGLFDDDTVEMFAAFDKPFFLFNGIKQDTANMPSRLRNAIIDFYKRRPSAERAYEAMVGNNEQAKVDQCIKCMFANFDNTADLNAKGELSPEVVRCGKRGVCKFENLGCLPLPIIKKLSPAQKRVVEICELSNEEIASKLFISTNTVNRHLQDAMAFTGAKNSKQLVKMITISNLTN